MRFSPSITSFFHFFILAVASLEYFLALTLNLIGYLESDYSLYLSYLRGLYESIKALLPWRLW
jgi:hypothetical protein